MKLLLLALVVAACAPPPPPAVPPAQPRSKPTVDCEPAGRNVAAVLHLDADHAPAIAAVVADHCHRDGWTVEAAACVSAAVDHDAALKCAYEHLTEQQHDLVVRDMRLLLPAPPAAAPPAAAPEGGSQAEIAAREDAEGKQLLAAGHAGDASAKFRDAAARVPEAAYFLDLCASLHAEGKFGEALSACSAVDRLSPDPATRSRAQQLAARIRDDASAQKLDVPVRR